MDKERGKGIVIGLGAGRSGTSSLAALLNVQPGTVCFHELNPSSMAWSKAESTVGSLMRDFCGILSGEYRAVTADLVSPGRLKHFTRLMELENIRAIGDVASYYLPYVDMLLEHWPAVRFPCLRRSRNEVIESFAAKLRSPSMHPPRNHWADPVDTRWSHDPIWYKCFPKVAAERQETLEDYVAMYYDLYYEMADKLAQRYPKRVRIFDLEQLNSPEGRHAIVAFCIPGKHYRDYAFHKNKRGEDA